VDGTGSGLFPVADVGIIILSSSSGTTVFLR
jgi:hypothetical protein